MGGLGVSSEEEVRLRTIKNVFDDCPDALFTAPDGAVAGDLLKSYYSAVELFMETKPELVARAVAVAGQRQEGARMQWLGEDGWPKTYGEFGVKGSHQHHRVLKLAYYSPPDAPEPVDGQYGSTTETHARTLEDGTMSEFFAVTFGYHATLGDVCIARFLITKVP